jgi:hypothetical protein
MGIAGHSRHHGTLGQAAYEAVHHRFPSLYCSSPRSNQKAQVNPALAVGAICLGVIAGRHSEPLARCRETIVQAAVAEWADRETRQREKIGTILAGRQASAAAIR